MKRDRGASCAPAWRGTASPAPPQTRSCTAITSFALYGFPESHAASFALLAYASAYLKAHHPAAFYAALLNNQPMGFYHPATLVKDAQRHGVEIRPVDVTRSSWRCTVERGRRAPRARATSPDCAEAAGRRHRDRARGAAVRVGGRPRRRAPGSNADELPTLADVGALAALGGTRRGELWAVAAPSAAGPLFATAVERGGPRRRWPLET